MELYLDTNAPAIVIAADDAYRGNRIDPQSPKNAGAAANFCVGTDNSALRLPDTRHLIALLPLCAAGEALQSVTVALDAAGRLDPPCAGCRTIDWGGGMIELCADMPFISRAINSPAMLQRLNFPSRDGRRRNVELYRDNGIRLNVTDGSGERSFVLCGGTDGSMRVLDVGRERLLIVHAKDGETEHLIALEGNFEVAASIDGARCSVDDGYLTAVAPLGTVMGHERRTRYELRAGRLERLPDEVGFFGSAPVFPADAVGIALALMEAVMLGRGDEAARLMSPELNVTLELDDLRGFFGEFDECRPAPWQGIDAPDAAPATVVCGAVRSGSAKKFTFSVESGRVTDITEE